MSSKKRINKPISVTLTPEGAEALEILKEELDQTVASRVVDVAIRESVSSRNYQLIEEGGNMQVNIVHEGKVLSKHSLDESLFLEAPLEGNYIIRLYNDSWQRRMAVVSVDGVNIINGEDASIDGPGYVLEPYQTMDINGWHRTNEEAAAFTFEKNMTNAYVNQTGRGIDNTGVIGVAVFEEKRDYIFWRYNPKCWCGNYHCPGGLLCQGGNIFVTNTSTTISSGLELNESSTSVFTASVQPESGGVKSMRQRESLSRSVSDQTFGAVTNCASDYSLGTGYGEKLAMHTTSTTFTKQSSEPVETISFIYAARDSLIKWGVIKENKIPKPDPFPIKKVGVAPPPGWKG